MPVESNRPTRIIPVGAVEAPHLAEGADLVQLRLA